MKEYVTEEVYNKAKNSSNSIDVGLTNSMYIVFGTYGMSLHSISKKVEKVKHINDWKNLSVKNINDTLNKIAWEEN